MSAYHQMGHLAQNLLHDPDLGLYAGAILSPVNYEEEEVAGQIAGLKAREQFDTVFDPQLYCPKATRGKLPNWSYYPSDVDTADVASMSWWYQVIDRVVETCAHIGPRAVCSPAMLPNAFTDQCFSHLVDIGNRLSRCLEGTGILPIQTVVAHLPDLAAPDRALQVASIVTRTAAERVYLILVSPTEPRREFDDPEPLKGGMRLIRTLEDANLPVIVAFSSSDVLLWKFAGASACATGKYFNLRRFTKSRFDEPAEGGGQLPYWIEESLLAFLRESDLIRVRNHELMSPASDANPFGQQILSKLDETPGAPWLGLGWRQFMYWFADIEQRISAGAVDVEALLRTAETNWLRLEDAKVLMEEPRNDGRWLRPWRRALLEHAQA